MCVFALTGFSIHYRQLSLGTTSIYETISKIPSLKMITIICYFCSIFLITNLHASERSWSDQIEKTLDLGKINLVLTKDLERDRIKLSK